MLIATNAIVLSKLKYRDNDLIIKCYTQEKGIISVLEKGILNRKKNAKAAYFQALSQLHFYIDYKPKRSLHYIKDVRIAHIYNSLHSSISKSAIVLFLSEVLAQVIQEEEPNSNMYHFLETSLLWLDVNDSTANFHLLFLLNLTKYLGFYPETSNIEAQYFNIVLGKFQNNDGFKETIDGFNLTLLKQLLGTNFVDLDKIKLNATQRQSFLSVILLYYELHLQHFKTPKSLYVFNEVFN